SGSGRSAPAMRPSLIAAAFISIGQARARRHRSGPRAEALLRVGFDTRLHQWSTASSAPLRSSPTSSPADLALLFAPLPSALRSRPARLGDGMWDLVRQC